MLKRLRVSCCSTSLWGAVLAVAVSAGIAAGLSGCASETPGAGTKRIIILTNGDDPFWDACEAGAKSAAKELGLEGDNYEVLFQRAEFTDRSQIEKLKQYNLDPSVVAVGISVYNPDSRAVADEMRALREKGVKVITIDGDVSREKFRDARWAYIGTNNVIGGKELGRAAAVLAGGAEVDFAFFVGNTGAANAIARMDGFTSGAGEGFHELTRLEDGADRPKARKNVEDTVDKYPDIDMLVGIWAYNTPQMIQVVRDRKLRDQIKVVGFDAAEAALREMGGGYVDALVVQNPYQMGYDGVKLMKALVEGDRKDIESMFPNYEQEGAKDTYRTELRVVVPEGSPIKKDVFEPDTEFFTLPEFQKWLRERGLVSS
jgi:ribose transport system substrate-binding protein